jgi:hypothetical protein
MFGFKKKINKKETEQFFSYLNIECKDGKIDVYGGICNEDIKNWLYGVTKAIQLSMRKHPIIENYLVGQIWLGGQQVEFALVKDFKEGPHAMRMKAEEEVKKLKAELEQIKTIN